MAGHEGPKTAQKYVCGPNEHYDRVCFYAFQKLTKLGPTKNGWQVGFGTTTVLHGLALAQKVIEKPCVSQSKRLCIRFQQLLMLWLDLLVEQ